jgi:NADPH:quinone reductase-like Zn-dependent oxidoreductase
MVGDFQTPFAVIWTAFTGIVLVGLNVKDVAVGDRICGAGHGMSQLRPERDSFSWYNVTIGGVNLKFPTSMGSIFGSSLCAGLCTAGLAIRSLELPIADARVEKSLMVVVYGGSTATGTLAIQLLRLQATHQATNAIDITTYILQRKCGSHCHLFAKEFR